MAKIVSKGFTDTAIPENPVLVRGKLNFAKDFRVKSENGKTLILTNLTSPLDRNEEIMYSVSSIQNIYDKTDIDPSVYAPSKRGISLYAKISETYQVSDDTDAEFVQNLPIKASISISVPASQYITATEVQTIVARLVSTLYETGSESTDRLNALLRGSLKPSDL